MLYSSTMVLSTWYCHTMVADTTGSSKPACLLALPEVLQYLLGTYVRIGYVRTVRTVRTYTCPTKDVALRGVMQALVRIQAY
jgi:hypothetical protein